MKMKVSLVRLVCWSLAAWMVLVVIGMWVMMILLPSTLTFDVPCVKRCNSTDLPKETCDKETYKLVCEVYNEIIDLKYEI